MKSHCLLNNSHPFYVNLHYAIVLSFSRIFGSSRRRNRH